MDVLVLPDGFTFSVCTIVLVYFIVEKMPLVRGDESAKMFSKALLDFGVEKIPINTSTGLISIFTKFLSIHNFNGRFDIESVPEYCCELQKTTLRSGNEPFYQ